MTMIVESYSSADTEPSAHISDPYRLVPASRPFHRAVALVLLALAAFDVLVHLPPTVMGSQLHSFSWQATHDLLPQGWAFFTKSPRDAEFHAYSVAAGTRPVHDLSLGPHASPGNFFGWNRRSRSQGVEIGVLVAQVPVDHWTDCGSSGLDRCVQRAAAPIDIQNTMPAPTVCGDILLTQEVPVPWAYRHLTDQIRRLDKMVAARVRCTA